LAESDRSHRTSGKEHSVLAKDLSKGTKIIGLADLLGVGLKGAEAGGDKGKVSEGSTVGSYSFSRSLLSSNTVTFHADGKGKNKVTILPYYQGGINSAPLGGGEVISGPFNGCIMAIYKSDGGHMEVCHVDTAPSSETVVDPKTRRAEPIRPSKAKWQQMKTGPGIEVAAELSTAGLVTDYVFGGSDKPKVSAPDTISILCVASPEEQISYVYVRKVGKNFVVLAQGKK
jgi:hypothetical protein